MKPLFGLLIIVALSLVALGIGSSFGINPDRAEVLLVAAITCVNVIVFHIAMEE